MLQARDRRVAIQNKMLEGASADDTCLVCLTLNIAGEIKRTPMTLMLFRRGIREFDALGLECTDHLIIDETTGSEAFWKVKGRGSDIKPMLEEIEEAFPAARLFDFDVLMPGHGKLSRAVSRRCLICGEPAADCARSRKHGLEAVKKATGELLRELCAEELAQDAAGSLLDELYTTPKPGLVDLMSNGAHKDMDVPLLEKSAGSLRQYFHDAALLGMDGCSMPELRERGLWAEQEMFKATGGINTHKGMVYSMGLLTAGMGKALTEPDPDRTLLDQVINNASALACQDSDRQLAVSYDAPKTNGGNVLRKYGAKGATGEAAAGFPDAVYCAERLRFYKEHECELPGALAFCDSMARLEDTNLLHRGGKEGLEYAKSAAERIAALPEKDRPKALAELDAEMIKRNLSPGGSADMLALAYLFDRWEDICEGEYLQGEI